MVIDINKAVADYVRGNIVISVLATIATWAVLSILGVPYALSLGFVVGFFDLIPLAAAIQIVLRDWWANRQHPDPTAPSSPTQRARGSVQGIPADEPSGA